MSFRANVIAMLSGTAAAQAIPLALSPVLTRLYSPEAIGLQTLFMGWTAALGVAATCRYDLAVVLPDSEDEADSIAAMTMAIATVVLLMLTTVVALVGSDLARLSGYGSHTAWLWLLVPMVLGTTLTLLGTSYASRARSFARIAKAAVVNQAGYAIIAVAIGLLGAHAEGLVWAKAGGQLLGLTIILGGVGYALWRAALNWNWPRMREAGRHYRQFLYYNTPYSLIGTIARDMPIFVFAAMSATAAAGFYGLTRTVLLAPTLLVSGALSQVFFREAVALKGAPRLADLTEGLLKLGLLAGAPLFAFCAVWGDVLFETLFGATWNQAGHFAMIMAPAAWMSLQTGWPERLFEVSMRQDVSFKVQIAADIITAVAVIAPWAMGLDVIISIAAFTVANVLYHCVYLVAIYRVSGFEAVRLARLLGLGWGAFGLSCLALGALRLLPGHALVLAVAAAVVASAVAALSGRKLWRGVALIMQAKETAS
ncbi:lipopolysaccharide biosynthesis protein [Achromobacter xylosoxidans]|uniref:lipopolysaccharide biosynthesis protein n=1 Tax=Alcaligenes xylosoxydans xylosoxydans TaxID=85698 RepID=UPI003C243C6A